MHSALRSLAKQVLPIPLVALARARKQGVEFVLHRDLARRIHLLRRFQLVSDNIRCEQSEAEALLVATSLLRLSPNVAGVIVECGCYQGGSTAKLSIIAAEIDRRVVVFDSFCGLPSPSSGRTVAYHLVGSGQPVSFSMGDYSSSLNAVQRNVSEFGEPRRVDYVPGFFVWSLSSWQGQAAAVILDVDLAESTRECVAYFWPRLSTGGMLFSQDCHLQEVCDLLTDKSFWQSLGESSPPRFVGLGTAKMVYAIKASLL